MKRHSVNYDNITVTCNGYPSKEYLMNYYSMLIDYYIKKYGKESVKRALEELISENED